jgi:hypothetical protein
VSGVESPKVKEKNQNMYQAVFIFIATVLTYTFPQLAYLFLSFLASSKQIQIAATNAKSTPGATVTKYCLSAFVHHDSNEHLPVGNL